MTGAYAAFALLAADRRRRENGRGSEIKIPLSDVAMATMSHLGQIAEVTLSGADRPRYGNDVYGAYGRDFMTRDGRRIMLTAITPKQWSSLRHALGIEKDVAMLETSLNVSFKTDEGVRFTHRDAINPLVASAVRNLDYADLMQVFDANDVCWGPYRTLSESLKMDGDLSARNPVFTMMSHSSGATYLTAGSAATFSGDDRQPPQRAPKLGEHTDEILSTYLRLSDTEIGRLHDEKIIAGADH
jgi:2-methylfumaryl-CoA isomerase